MYTHIRSNSARRTRGLLALATATAATVGPGALHGTVPTEVTVVGMTVTGFDATVAAQNGYEIRTDSAGRQYSAPQGSSTLAPAPGDLSVAPYNVVTGNCGSSYVYLYDIGDKKYRVSTGFGVVAPAVGYTWSANVVGPRYNTTHRWTGGLFFRRTWQGAAVSLVNVAGVHTARASGWAVLSNGAICRSLGPIDNEAIF